ncbi:MAG: metal ABC transporter substrate-binding protein [Mogibacterium sp.]|nr:metal ABC transporter substrate-binding protein [Mogibacterium sp.]
MKLKKLLAMVLIAIMACCLATACGSNSSEEAASEETAAAEKTDVKIGVRSDLIDYYNAVEPILKEAGYNVEMVSFDDSIQPNVALAEGSIDLNWYQHEPYLKAYNAENGTDFVMVQPKTYAPLFAMYSTKHASVDELPDGAVIGVCNDATNQDRGLKMLADNGLITLDETVEVATIHDIKDNPHNFTFQEAEMQMLPQSIDDLDAICLAGQHMVNAGNDASAYIMKSNDEEVYAVGFVANAADADSDWAKGIAEAVQCDELANALAEISGGALLPTWK